jgi:hypothetical protein
MNKEVVMNTEFRLARLEAENRLLKGVALVTLIVAILPWVMGSEAAIQDHVQARRFTLIGNDEAPAGSWSFDKETRTATLSVQSSKASPSVVLASSVDSSSVRLRRREFRDADIALTVGETGTTINVNEGTIAIEDGRKTVFVAPPRAAILPVTRK